MIRKICTWLLALLLTANSLEYVHAESAETMKELVQLDVVQEEIQIQEETLPQQKRNGITYLEGGKILNYGTGTYLYDFGMNAVTIGYQGSESLALLQELYLQGERVYCIEPEVLTAEGEGYLMSAVNGVVSSAESRTLGLISYFGYGYKGDTSDVMNAATIAAIWMARGRTVSDVSDEVMQAVRVIQARVANVDVHPSFEKENLTLTGYGKKHAVVLTDTNGVLEDYHIYQDGGYSIEKSGNTLKVWLEQGQTGTGKIIFDRIERSEQGSQIVYVNPDGKQKLMRIYAQSSESVELLPTVAKGSVRIQKLNEDGVPLPNTSFTLSYHANMTAPIGTFTTDASGSALIEELEPREIYIQEVAVPDPYVLDSAIEKVEITGNAVISYTKVNRYKQGYVQVLKKDTSSKAQILKAGVRFDIFTDTGVYVQSIYTKEDGAAISTALRYGSYYIKEVAPPDGYLISSEAIPFTIQEEGVTLVKECYNDRVQASIEIQKQDGVTGNTPQGEATLEGAVYGLYAAEDILSPDDGHVLYTKDTLIDKRKIEQGHSIFQNLLLGKYYVKELLPSPGYTLDETIYPVDCLYENAFTPIVVRKQVVTERVKSQSFQIIKISTDGSSQEVPLLQGAEFTIKSKRDVEKFGWDAAPAALNAQAQTAAVLVTDEKGHAVSEELPYGSYIIKETKAPVGTQPVQDFEVHVQDDDRNPQVWRIFNDAPIKAHIKVIKVDAHTGKPIAVPFIKFKIRNLDTNEYVKFWIKYPSPYLMDTFETDDTGSFTTPEGLPYGRYQIEELQAPSGYILDSEPLQFEIGDNSAYETIEETGELQLVLKKENKPAEGRIQIEKKANLLETFDFRMTAFGKLYEPVFKEGWLADVQFEIIAKEDIRTPDGTVWYRANEHVETLTTTATGPVISSALPLGTYLIREISAPEGYAVGEEIMEVTLAYEGQFTPVVTEIQTVWNEKETAQLLFQKEFEPSIRNEEQSPIRHTRFGIYTREPLIVNGVSMLEEHALVGIAEPDASGYVNFQLHFAGKYYIRELESDDRYLLDTAEYPVVYEYSGLPSNTIQLEGTPSLINYLKKGRLQIFKQDEEHQPLADVRFLLSTSMDFKENTMEVVTDAYGMAEMDGLEYGTYYVKEMETGELYMLDDQVYVIQLYEELNTLQITNKLRKSKLVIHKINEQNESLADAEFSLYDDTGNLLAVKTTDEKGYVRFDELRNGIYHVKETKAPDGYQEDFKEWEVIIAGNGLGETYTYEIMNHLIVQTGLADATFLWYGIIILGSIMILLLQRRKKLAGQNIRI